MLAQPEPDPLVPPRGDAVPGRQDIGVADRERGPQHLAIDEWRGLVRHAGDALSVRHYPAHSGHRAELASLSASAHRNHSPRGIPAVPMADG